MTTPLMSVLIPTRARPERLIQTARSFRGFFDSDDDVEILVRIDHDDADTIAAISRIVEAGPNVRVFGGSRLGGYADLHVFYGELAKLAVAPWVWIMNDDAWVRRQESWQLAMEFAPSVLPGFFESAPSLSAWLRARRTDRVIIQPDVYQLNQSRYPKCEGGAFPIVPTRCWEQFGYAMPESPIDTWLDHTLRQYGWVTEFLPGVTVQHDRDADDVLAEHRRMS